MPTEKLTKRVIDAAKPGQADVMIWDTEVKGFGFRLTPKGTKSFVFLYRGPDGKQRKPTIGRFGVMTVEQARERAREMAYHVTLGRDPSLERQRERSAPTIAELCERFLEDHVRPKNKPKTVKEAEGIIRNIVIPKLGRLRVADVSRGDIAKFHSAMKKTPYLANRCLALMSKMLNLAEVWELRPDGTNPCRRIEKFPEKARDRYLSREEVGRLNDVLDRYEPATPHMVAAIRLLLLTGARSNEIKTLKWSYIDLDNGRINLPDTKTGKRSIPISEPVRRVLQVIPRVPGSPWVIAGRQPDAHVQDLQKFWQRVREEAGLQEVRIHDLRHTFASFGLAANLSLRIVGDLLGHSQPATTARYAHIADKFQQENAGKVANAIAATMEINRPERTARDVALEG